MLKMLSERQKIEEEQISQGKSVEEGKNSIIERVIHS